MTRIEDCPFIRRGSIFWTVGTFSAKSVSERGTGTYPFRAFEQGVLKPLQNDIKYSIYKKLKLAQIVFKKDKKNS